MDSTVVLLALDFTSVMLAVILVTAWNSFGRPAHALIWSAAFAIAAVGWTARLLGGEPLDTSLMQTAARILAMVAWAMLLVGFNKRAAKARPAASVAGMLALAVAALVFFSFSPHVGLVHAVPMLFASVMLALSAATMMFRAGSQAERAVVAMLLALAILDLVGALAAVRAGPSGDPERLAFFRTLMMTTQPSAFLGAGLFAVFLLAADLAERMGKLAASDALTGILNRRGFQEAAAGALANAFRLGQPLTLVMADLDRFKAINDRYGHAAGDAVLCRFAEHVAGSIRCGDLFGRIGGEEFALLLVGAPPAAAAEAIDRIRAALGRLDIDTPKGPVRVTASFGLTGAGAAEETLADLLARADHALYQSKLAGRDRVTVAPIPEPVESRPAVIARKPAGPVLAIPAPLLAV